MPEPTQQELGQWFTPEPVADLALALALGQRRELALLDPSCGDGVFLRRAAAQGVAQQNLCGVDIDARALAEARSAVPDAKLVHGDFFKVRELEVQQFDVVVGNPPYVRQERLGPGAKEAMLVELASAWPQLDKAELRKLVGRSDLAAPFLLATLRQLRQGGRAALVISSAFLDSGYGAQFWRLVGRVASVTTLIDAPKERWFQDAAVNTIIAVFEATPQTSKVCLARLTSSTAEAAQLLGKGAQLAEVAELRFAPADQPSLWAGALRAPSAWFALAAEADTALTTLGQVATLRRGLTSGANDIFYLPIEEAKQRQLPGQFLYPLLRGRQERIGVAPESCTYCVLAVPAGTQLQDHPSLQDYLQSFAKAEQRKTLAARQPWWSLRVQPAQVFLSKAYAERFVQPFSAEPLVADQRMYCVHPNADVHPALLAAVLNGISTTLALESLGRSSMGEGALEWTVGDAAQLPILDPRCIKNSDEVLKAFAAVTTRATCKLAQELRQPERIALDRALLHGWPNIWAIHSEMEAGLVQACEARQARPQLKSR